ncbi:MAG TPA: TetR/AcrR family transcriptional regulator [Anaeromyxobacter sp.]
MDRNVNGGSIPARGQSRRERRREEERFRIIRAAERVYRERGFAAAGMREIAAEADLSPANLYHYFASKEELLYFCQDRALDRLQEELEIARSARGPVDERLHDFAAAHVLCLIDDAEGSAAHFEVDALSPELRARIAAKRARYKDGLRALIALGMRRGELRRADPTLAMRGFSGALNWTAHWYRPDGPHTAEEVAEQIADYAVAGLTARAPGATRRRARDRRADGPRRSRNGAARDARDEERRRPGAEPDRRDHVS